MSSDEVKSVQVRDLNTVYLLCDTVGAVVLLVAVVVLVVDPLPPLLAAVLLRLPEREHPAQDESLTERPQRCFSTLGFMFVTK